MKRIAKYEVVDHGIEHSQYFSGCGTSFTRYDECVTGCGDNFAEALGDALEQMSQQDFDFAPGELRRVETIEKENSQHVNHVSAMTVDRELVSNNVTPSTYDVEVQAECGHDEDDYCDSCHETTVDIIMESSYSELSYYVSIRFSLRKDTLPYNHDGKLSSYAWPGGYPLFYLDEENNVLCSNCAWQLLLSEWDETRPVSASVNYENGSLFCEHCNKRIESSYAENDEEINR